MIINLYSHLRSSNDGISGIIKNLTSSERIFAFPSLTLQIVRNASNSIFILHGCYDLRILTRSVALKVLGKRVYWCPHGSLQSNTLTKSRIKKLIYHYLISFATLKFIDAIIFVSEGERSRSRWLTGTTESIVIQNGVAELDYQGDASRSGVIYIGRIDLHHKGIDRILSWMEASPFTVQLFGPNPSKITTQLVNVKIRAPLKRSEVERRLCSSSVFLLLSRYEGMPLAALEALSAGCIVIVTDETNIADCVREFNCGFVVSTSDDLFTALNFIHDPLNTEAVKNMRERATQLARTHFSLASQIQKYESLYAD